jgi:radical SAM family uncharacterized protein/radical SAM-linked protein
MKHNSQDSLLFRVNRPSRYLGTETNSHNKSREGARVLMALAFPDLYEVGTSHFGIQILYSLLNSLSGVVCDRVFTPDSDMEALLREKGLPLSTLETKTPLGELDILGFSLLYELNSTNVLNMLDLAGIPLRAADRGPGHPLVIAGGPCVSNPEPVALFFDAMVLGDGEDAAVEMVRLYADWKERGAGSKQELLEAWAELEGVYVPGFFTADPGTGALRPTRPGKERVRKALVPDLSTAFFPDRPIVPNSNPVHDRLRLEMARGCTRGCRFCQAGMIYRPVRERGADTLLDLACRSMDTTGYEELSLLSLSTGDYSQIGPFLSAAMAVAAPRKVAVSFPSMRAGTLSPGLMEEIKKVRKTGFTIAPEAGSQRLRDVINKNVTEEQIVETAGDAVSMGWRLIKLYFMIGLPTETKDDVLAIAGLVKAVKRRCGRRMDVNVSVGVFVPKPHTPFQWEAQETVAGAREKIRMLKEALGQPGIRLKWHDPEVSAVEGVFSRGGRELAPVLEAAFRDGARLDGWSDHFDFARWTRALESRGLSLDSYVGPQRDPAAPLPWDHMDTGVDKAFLLRERERALEGTPTGDCREGECQGCGVCDFKKVFPRLSGKMEQTFGKAATMENLDPNSCHRVRVVHDKTGPARFYGHLEFAAMLHRALRRARIPMLYSQGFHPLPKVSFTGALPVGVESEAESFTVMVPRHVRPRDLAAALEGQLPEGVRVLSSALALKEEEAAEETWLAELPAECPAADAVAGFLALEKFPVTVPVKDGGEKTLDARQHVRDIFFRRDGRLEFTLAKAGGARLKPVDFLGALLNLSGEAKKDIRLRKLASKDAGAAG